MTTTTIHPVYHLSGASNQFFFLNFYFEQIVVKCLAKENYSSIAVIGIEIEISMTWSGVIY